MSQQPLRLHLPDFVDERRMTPYQFRVVALCGLVMFIDGFDTQAISYMAPTSRTSGGCPGTRSDRCSRPRWSA